MALKTFVKISDVSNLSDARYCAGMLVNYMGFNIDSSSSKAINVDEFTAISSWLAGVDFVGEFISDDATQIIETAKAYDIQIVETIHPQIVAQLKNDGLSVILKISNDSVPELLSADNLASDYIHVYSNDFDAEIDLGQLGKLNEICPVLLGYGITPDNIIELVDSGKISGIAMAGGDEIKPGYKDYDELADILEPLEIED
ncbi:phosphoribosylanthranilate isomerase [Fulvivirgaceae bacterium LMO-SS25]